MRFPKDVSLNRINLNSFPILFIRDLIQVDPEYYLEKIPPKSFVDFFETYLHLRGEKTPEQIESEKQIEGLFGQSPDDCPF